MSKLNKNLLIPLCLMALALGYFGAEYLVPKYFSPPPHQSNDIVPSMDKSKSAQLISMLKMNHNYIRKTNSGNYLAGKFAQNHKDWRSANKFISSVLPTATPEQIAEGSYTDSLKSHAMILSMSAGKADEAIKLAEVIYKKDPANVLATLFVTIDYLKNNQYQNAKAVLNQVEQQSIASFIVPVISLWSDTLNLDGSKNKDIKTDKLIPTNLYVYHALLAGLFVDNKEAVKPYAVRSFKIEELDARDVEKFADIFYLYGEKETAIELLTILKERNFSNEETNEKLERLQEDKAIDDILILPDINSPKQAIALVLSDMAEILIREYSDDSANVFAQMALYLDPSLIRPHLIISDIYARNDRYEDAVTQLQNIPSSSDDYIYAQRQISDLYNQQDDDIRAIEILRKIYDETGDIDALNQIGDIYRYNEEFKKAIQTYSEIIKKLEPIPSKYWYVLYARGMSYEREGDFKKAEKDLLAALEFRPDEPYLLNYLGYSWADQDMNLEQSLEMIEKAVMLRPDDGYIADSLGWVNYKLGNYDEAIKYLERAVGLLPYDATINDHLGDAYWRGNRKNEAKFQWRRALNNQETEDLELSTSLKDKIQNGLTTKKKDLPKLSAQPSAKQKNQ